jgi:SAM-dependent methyltransferase
MNKFLRGEALYGDDLDEEGLKEWFVAQTNAYSDKLGDIEEYPYQYHAVDKLYGFTYITKDNLNVLGIGSANGAELLPIWQKIAQLTIIENSDKYNNILIDKTKINYLLANYKGFIEAHDNTFDLVICLSCLHHIANVSFVMSEITRVLKNNGLAIIREPINSMGDWNRPRKGLTKNERGIPLKIFRQIIEKNGLVILSEKIWNFRPFGKMFFFYKRSIFNNKLLTILDGFLARLFSWNIHYYPKSFLHRIGPSSVFYVLRK